jgi:hypothetical protein
MPNRCHHRRVAASILSRVGQQFAAFVYHSGAHLLGDEKIWKTKCKSKRFVRLMQQPGGPFKTFDIPQPFFFFVREKLSEYLMFCLFLDVLTLKKKRRERERERKDPDTRLSQFLIKYAPRFIRLALTL